MSRYMWANKQTTKPLIASVSRIATDLFLLTEDDGLIGIVSDRSGLSPIPTAPESNLPFNRVIPTANHLLRSLPRRDQDQLLVNCEHIELVYAEVLYRHGELIPYVYFPIQSNISLVTSGDGNAGLEAGLVGDEGMLGITLIQGVDIAPLHAVVQGAGLTLRIPTPSFRIELERSYVLQRTLQRYLYVSMCQLAQKVTCARFHVVEARLARWLLMTHDRAHSDSFHVTHVFLAKMLGVRRVGITKAANSLQNKQLISYHRGNIKILDRIGLEAVSCECYRADKKIYEHILGCRKLGA